MSAGFACASSVLSRWFERNYRSTRRDRDVVPPSWSFYQTTFGARSLPWLSNVASFNISKASGRSERNGCNRYTLLDALIIPRVPVPSSFSREPLNRESASNVVTLAPSPSFETPSDLRGLCLAFRCFFVTCAYYPLGRCTFLDGDLGGNFT